MKRLVTFVRSVALGATLVAGLAGAQAQQAPAAPNAEADLAKILSAPVIPSHLAVAEQVLKASGLRTMFENSMPNVVGALRVNVTRQRPELAKDIEAALKTVEESGAKLIDSGVSGAARLMASKLTEAELKEVLTFMTSPVGKKYVEALPSFMDLVVPYLQVWSQEAGGQMTKTFANEMAKRGHKL
ncbi:MAG TPA: DUF2059 domain-containing protein [Rhabdaerophilum sp.]|nr:DUF2059 domain-containing protein [Rhabdaerophilum sp.]